MTPQDRIHPDSLITYEQQIAFYRQEMGRLAAERQLEATRERTLAISRNRRANRKSKKESGFEVVPWTE